MNKEQTLPVTRDIAMIGYYDKSRKCWWGFYVDRKTGEQIGDAWNAYTRDNLLLFRPDTPSFEA
jgi:hypothetical protein